MNLVLPLVGLAVVAWLVPWMLGKLLPEGVIWLLVNGVLSALLLAVVAAAGFVWLYGEAGGVVWREAPWHFVLLSAKAGIVWGPVMVLSLSALPKRWKEVVW
ncbi:MAG: hypothetical protein WBA02_00980 [Jannaschia helgolandensis]|uniref:Uncharacterized protein n=1 Tax=Jannaschia helgolandensis TaxID=188906 RepID=A0A1H7FK11_9RHOB|nr:hypothetical protein [Jannaschia helgolandensis]SEK26436.1 hypothetical protein SAMN04488526_0141 [Jannaschia helgolandensis]